MALPPQICGLSAAGFHQAANDTDDVLQNARTEIHFTKRRERRKKRVRRHFIHLLKQLFFHPR